ncbi:MAG: single-stranded DNA-binding protein [Nocardioides sp.]|nr:single-stranded DNA-binding protein [Nocardioides sp.]
MNETMISFQGWVGTDVEERYVGESIFASFRVASTPRRFVRQQNGWVDLETNWYTVNAWRSLAHNCAESLEVGDAVLVHGKQTTQVYKDDNGNERQVNIIEAISVGHDFAKGTATFSKASASGEQDGEAVRQVNADLGVSGPQVNSNGETLDDMVAEGPAA